MSYLVAYEVKMPPADRREMVCRTEEVMDRSLRYLNNVPQNQYSRVVSRAVRELVAVSYTHLRCRTTGRPALRRAAS